MSELYLILHKVRGKPAFDIAELCEEMGTDIDPGPWWIIPTSGHRAYPFRQWRLDDLADESDINNYGYHPVPWFKQDELPDDWPDHCQYDLDRTPPSPIVNGDVASALANLIKPKEPMKRRM